MHIQSFINPVRSPSAAHRRLVAGVAAVVLAGSAVPAAAAPASAAGPRVTPCVNPYAGFVIQDAVGISAAVVSPGCDEIKSGARWTVPVTWYAAQSWQGVPPGYEPVSATPLDDFKAHFVGLKLVIDGGTRSEFTVEWPNGPRLWTGVYRETGSPTVWDAASPITLGTVRPLSVGRHTVGESLLLSATTCDGTSGNPDFSCAPAGELFAGTVEFRVVP